MSPCKFYFKPCSFSLKKKKLTKFSFSCFHQSFYLTNLHKGLFPTGPLAVLVIMCLLILTCCFNSWILVFSQIQYKTQCEHQNFLQFDPVDSTGYESILVHKASCLISQLWRNVDASSLPFPMMCMALQVGSSSLYKPSYTHCQAI